MEEAMRVQIALTLAAIGVLLAGSAPAFAKHEPDVNFPWVQTQSVRGPKMQRDESEHWGKHHHHGIFLEGSDFDRTPAPAYD
jgi:hypothetical protein